MNQRFRQFGAGMGLALLLGAWAGLPIAHAQGPASGSVGFRPPAGAPASSPTGNGPRPLASTITKDGELLRLSRDVAGDAKPVVIEADHITTWNDGGHVVLILEGQGLVQQGVIQGRFARAVAFVDLPRYQKTGILHVALYAEGQVRLDSSAEIQDGAKAAVDLHTRGEFKLRALKGKIDRADRSKDPLVVRARAAKVGPVVEPIKPAKHTEPLTPPPGLLPPPGTMAPPGSTPPGSTPPGSTPPGSAAPSMPMPTTGRPVMRPARGDDPAPAASPVSAPRTTLPPLPGTETPSRFPPMGGSSGSLSGGSTPPKDPSPTPTPRGNGNPPRELPAPVPAPVPAPATLPAPVRGPSSPSVSNQLPAPRPAPGTPTTPPRNFNYIIGSRTGTQNWNVERTQLPDGRSMITVSNGVLLSISGLQGMDTLEVEADRAVVWTRDGHTNSDPKTGAGNEIEFYMAGHVVLRTQRPQSGDKIRIEADEMYYDTRRNVAVALQSRLEIKPSSQGNSGLSITEPIVLTAAELFQTSETTYELVKSEVFSSKLPSDPGLKLLVARATVEERRRRRTDLFGRPVLNRKTGEQLTLVQNMLYAENVVGTLEGVPFFYTPALYTDANDPLGPLVSVSLGGNRIFGFQGGVGLDVYKLFGVLPYEGTRWRAYIDYMSRRGPALGTTFTYQGFLAEVDPVERRLFPERVYDGAYSGVLKLYGLSDGGTDILGGQPPELLTFQPTGFRGRAFWQQSIWDLPGGYDIHAQVSKWSDRNFLEQYYKHEFDTSPNQATFAMIKQQQDNWSWSALVEGRVNPWLTTTESFPRLDGYLQGWKLFDSITSHTHATLGFHRLAVSNDPPLPVANAPPGTFLPEGTTTGGTTGRAAIFQEFALPLQWGAFNVAPYFKGAVVGYTEDVDGDANGQLWGGLGVRAHVPFTRLYEGVQSELFNVNGLNHKINLHANYFYAEATERYTQFLQIDRLNDFATDQANRELRPFQPLYYNSAAGQALASSPLYDPQRLALRRLVDNRFDTLDQINVLQLEVRQRLQTKRGVLGSQHIIDWMSLDAGVSLYPQADRDNFGSAVAFLEYDYNWNIGDRTSFQSSGWYDPNENGPRVTTMGLFFDRPDRTTYFVGYRQIDPLQSRAVTGAVTYTFSEKYSMTLSASYDLGRSAAFGNSLIFTRTGRDLQISMGFTYNSLQNNFGAIVEIVPNLASRRGTPGAGILGGQGMAGQNAGLGR
jgi:hypothetical protein